MIIFSKRAYFGSFSRVCSFSMVFVGEQTSKICLLFIILLLNFQKIADIFIKDFYCFDMCFKYDTMI